MLLKFYSKWLFLIVGLNMSAENPGVFWNVSLATSLVRVIGFRFLLKRKVFILVLDRVGFVYHW